jgi:hypothetical protein
LHKFLGLAMNIEYDRQGRGLAVGQDTFISSCRLDA